MSTSFTPRKVIDLSHVLYNSMPAWPTQPNLIYEQTSNVPRDGATIHTIRQMTTHTGTHVDAPLHFIAEGKGVDQLPIEAFTGEGIAIDLSHKKPKEEITPEDLKTHDKNIKTNDVLMLHTGWDKKLGFNPQYLFEWPYLTHDAAQYLVKKKIKAVGVDTLSVSGWDGTTPAHGPTTKKGSTAQTHGTLLGAGIIVIEALRNLDQVLEGEKTRRAYFIYPPISFRGAEGGPCRAIALLLE